MSIKTLTLTEFLTARLDEDEAARAAAEAQGSPPWRLYQDEREALVDDGIGMPLFHGSSLDSTQDAPLFAHVARWDPARVLGEVAAKRRIVEAVSEFQRGAANGDAATYLTVTDLGNAVLLALASVYAEHPDFRDEWRA